MWDVKLLFYLGYLDFDLDETKAVEDDTIPSKIIDYVINKMFSYFMWSHHINVLLPAKKYVKIPVIFNRDLANSSITERYTIVFDNTEYMIPKQVG